MREAAGASEGAGRAVEYEAPFAEVVADFRRTVERSAARLLALGEGEQDSRAAGDEGWTPKQIVGRGGTILRSSDGGRTWVRQESGTKQHIYALHVRDKRAWAVGGDGQVLSYER